MKLQRGMVKCPNMVGATNNEKSLLCDDSMKLGGWKIRKLYPINFNCAKNGKCVGRNSELRRAKKECEFREDCKCGDDCPGHNGSGCTFWDISKEKAIKDLKKSLKCCNPTKESDVRYELTLAEMAK
ncbi:hypothetical protein HOD96_03645 [Candidatus Falkowbacteria bacterium]|jgi:hypothetical protein|nr:hypothetical protein [Candidatus Falkowbacteria bacterium]MBT4433023.1 hypothetical protein [Candidatus Falkowbacteria bacterium]